MKTTVAAIPILLMAGAISIAAENPAFDDRMSVWFFARTGDLKSLQAALERKPEALNAMDPLNRTPLVYAAKSGKTEVVDFLLGRKGIDIETLDEYGNTAWHWAAMYGHIGVLRLMEKYKLDVDVRDRQGNTPLHVSLGNSFSNVHGRHAEVVRLLLSMGADPNALNDAHEPPLFSASTLVGRADAAAALLANERTDVGLRDKDGNTALHRAIGWGAVSLVKILLDRGADPATKNKQGETPADRLAKFRTSGMQNAAAAADQIEKLLKQAKTSS